MVVSEIKERLSPNIAPHTTAPTARGNENPVFWLMSTAMGVRATMVPTEVPIAIEIKHPIRNKPTMEKFAGINDKARFTVLDTPPAAVATAEKPPASK